MKNKLTDQELMAILDNAENASADEVKAAYQITKKIVELETGWAINEKTTF